MRGFLASMYKKNTYYIYYRHITDLPPMAISVPIGTEHYIWLKEISDKLGLSLKKTMEHLVSLYYNEMVKDSDEEIKEEKINYTPRTAHTIEMTAPSLDYQQRQSAAQLHQRNLYVNTIKNEAPKPAKFTDHPPKPVSSNLPSWTNYSKPLETHQTIVKQENIPNQEIFTAPFYNSTSLGCPSCGVSKNSDAKFCSNCGHSFSS